MVGAAGNVIKLLQNSMKGWKTELTSGGQTLCEVNIKRGIFQGDSLSPLLFIISLIPLTFVLRKTKAGYDLGQNRGVINHLLYMDDLKLYGKNANQVDTLVQTVRVVCSDISMEFGISKCATLTMKRGKLMKSDGISLPDGNKIRSLDEEGAGYKYLGILETDTIKHDEMKQTVRKEYFRRVRKILKSKLNGGNTIKAINTRAVAVIRYGAGIIDWRKDELREIDRKTRKLLTIYRALHPQADVDRLYMKRTKGGRGLIGIEECVMVETHNLIKYVDVSREKILKAVSLEQVLKHDFGRDNKTLQEERKEKLLKKPLHGQFHRGIEEESDPRSWNWLKKGWLKKETEGLLTAAQDQALRTNSIKHLIDKQDVSPKCRMCGDRDETVAHITAECMVLAQKYYKEWRHDKVAQVLHWHLCRMWQFDRDDNWYNHKPEPVTESEKTKILWDFAIQTDKEIEANRPDIVLLDKIERNCFIIDIACPFDTRIGSKEKEKIEKYQDLRRELKRIWKCKSVQVVPIVIGALGTITRNALKLLDTLGATDLFNLLQKACLLGSGRIIRKVLDI